MTKTTQLIIRLGLAFVFLYASISMFIDQAPWAGFVPTWMSSIMPVATFLTLHGIFELVLGLAILFNLWPKLVLGAAALDLLSILVFYGVDTATFRDVGLFCVALALWVETLEKKSTLK